MRVLDHVGNTLKALDEQRQRVHCYCPIKSVNEFTRFVRIHAGDICKQGMATFDFSTMYTAFD